MMRLFLILAGVAACGGTNKSDDSDSFLAFASTFAPFRTWTSFHDNGPTDDGTFPADVLGPRTQYINMVPPSGSTEFPVGTVIVEARESGAMKIFSGVKRGGGYNSGGATNWEWFELTENPIAITWRGLGPPPGDTYGGSASGTCNSCHTACGSTNDYVCSPELQLSQF